MEELMLEQFMKLSVQIGEFKGEIKNEINSLRKDMHAGFEAQGKRIDNLEKEVKELRVELNAQGQRIDNLEKEVKEMRVDLNAQSKETSEIRHIIEENTKDTASIFHDIFHHLGKKQDKIANFKH